MYAVLLAAALTASAQLGTSDCARDELNGPVHMVTTTFQSLKKQADGLLDTFQSPVSSDSYDRACMLVEHKRFSVDFVQDEHPQRIDATTSILHSNMGDDRVRERFDASGNRVEAWTTVAADGSFVGHVMYAYDAGGRIVRTDSFGPDGKATGFITYTRDANENVVRQVFHFGLSPDLTESFTYEFDTHGNWTKRLESANDPENDALTIRPIGILFRTITYYG
jgi:hypothetical protein